MEFVRFSSAAAEVIERSRRAGVKMSFSLLERELGTAPEDQIHREALIHTVRSLSTPKVVDAEAVPIERISVERFFGSGYERTTKRVLLHDIYGIGKGAWTPQFRIPLDQRVLADDMWGPFRWADDPDPDSAKAVSIAKELWQPGFAHFFLHPPPWFQLNMTPHEAHETLRAVVEIVLGDPADGTPISYARADPWHPWAPCFYGMDTFSWAWVVRRSDREVVVIVAAAEIDP